MEESAILGFFNRRFGVPVIDGGTARLPAMIGLSRALDLILTGRQVKAKEAFEMGLVNRIVATGTSLGQAVQLAHSITKFPQAALNHDRRTIYAAVYDSQSFNNAIQNEIMYTSKEIMEEMKKGIELFKSGKYTISTRLPVPLIIKATFINRNSFNNNPIWIEIFKRASAFIEVLYETLEGHLVSITLSLDYYPFRVQLATSNHDNNPPIKWIAFFHLVIRKNRVNSRQNIHNHFSLPWHITFVKLS